MTDSDSNISGKPMGFDESSDFAEGIRTKVLQFSYHAILGHIPGWACFPPDGKNFQWETMNFLSDFGRLAIALVEFDWWGTVPEDFCFPTKSGGWAQHEGAARLVGAHLHAFAEAGLGRHLSHIEALYAFLEKCGLDPEAWRKSAAEIDANGWPEPEPETHLQANPSGSAQA